jgi:ATP-dependent Clp protease ATP-binding subunit ClpX
MGFGADVKATKEKDIVELYKHLHPEDMVRFGLIPEFVGRLPITVTLKDLDVEDLERILKEPKNSILRQYQASLKLDDVELIFEDQAIQAMAGLAMSRKTGARGLRAIVESIMMEIMFELPSMEGKKRVVITQEVVENSEKPEVSVIQKSA